MILYEVHIYLNSMFRCYKIRIKLEYCNLITINVLIWVNVKGGALMYSKLAFVCFVLTTVLVITTSCSKEAKEESIQKDPDKLSEIKKKETYTYLENELVNKEEEILSLEERIKELEKDIEDYQGIDEKNASQIMQTNTNYLLILESLLQKVEKTEIINLENLGEKTGFYRYEVTKDETSITVKFEDEFPVQGYLYYDDFVGKMIIRTKLPLPRINLYGEEDLGFGSNYEDDYVYLLVNGDNDSIHKALEDNIGKEVRCIIKDYVYWKREPQVDFSATVIEIINVEE